jgi:hypothetical protein
VATIEVLCLEVGQSTVMSSDIKGHPDRLVRLAGVTPLSYLVWPQDHHSDIRSATANVYDNSVLIQGGKREGLLELYIPFPLIDGRLGVDAVPINFNGFKPTTLAQRMRMVRHWIRSTSQKLGDTLADLSDWPREYTP